MTVPGVYSPEQGGRRYITEQGQSYDGFIQDAHWNGSVPVSVEYKPSDAAMQAHVDKVIASDEVADKRTWAEGILDDAAYNMAMAAGRLSIACDGIDKLRFFREELKIAMVRYKDVRGAALGALRALEGEN